MGKELFSSVNMQSQKCGVCYSDDPEDVKKLGTILNHRVNQHPGFHNLCLKTWLSISQTCPICNDELDPDSFSLKEKEVKHVLPKEITRYALIYGIILSVFSAVISYGVFAEKMSPSNAAIAFSSVSQICLVGFVGTVLFQARLRQNEDNQML